MYNPNQQFDLIQAQLNNLKSLQSSVPQFNANQPYDNSQLPPSYEEQIQKLIQKELSKYIPDVPAPVQEVPLDPRQQLEKQINDLASAVLAPDDLKFLTDPEILKGVPLFLKSNRGKEAISLLMGEYRNYVEGKA
jgi:hypothetical protein